MGTLTRDANERESRNGPRFVLLERALNYGVFQPRRNKTVTLARVLDPGNK